MASTTLLHVINLLGNGGAEVQLRNTLQLLPEYEHILITLGSDNDTLGIEKLLAGRHKLQAVETSRWPIGVLQIRKLIRYYQPKLVHTHLQIAGLLTRFACPRKTPLFYTIHSPYSKDAFSANRFALPLERLAARPYHHLIGVSKEVLKDYKQHVPTSGSTDVLYNLVSGEFFKCASKKTFSYHPGNVLRCVSVGGLRKAKNYQYTLRAFDRLRDWPISLDIYGEEGPEKEALQNLIADKGLKNVRLMGSSNNIPSILGDYDLYIISSSYEGFGIAPLEAMAVGLPVFASGIPVLREVAGETVTYFDLNNESSLADLLKEVIRGNLDLRGFIEKGQKRAAEISLPQSYKANLLSIYNKYN